MDDLEGQRVRDRLRQILPQSHHYQFLFVVQEEEKGGLCSPQAWLSAATSQLYFRNSMIIYNLNIS